MPVMALLAGTGDALAASCDERIDQLAAEFDLSAPLPAEQPPASAGAGDLSERLARSGGVLAPPETDAGRVMEPPPTGDPMPTAPDVQGQPPVDKAQPGELSAADRQQVAALLGAARAATARGDEAQCFERVGEAEAILRSN